MKKRRMKERTISILLAVIMLTGIMPGIFNEIIPDTIAAAEGVDALGIDMSQTMSEGEKNNLKDNPYGTTGWVNLMPKMELAETITVKDTSTRKQRIYRFGRDNTTTLGVQSGPLDPDNNTYPETDSTISGGGHSLSASAAGDFLGTGRDEYVVHLVYHDGSHNLCLYMTDGSGKVITGKREIAGSRPFLHHVHSFHAMSHMAIATGDFDGDDKDTIIVYNPALKDSSALEEWSWDGNSFELKNRNIKLINLLGKDASDQMKWIDETQSDKGDRNFVRAIPSVGLAVDDTDRDGKDELLVTANWNDLYKDEYKDHKADWQGSYFSLWDNDNGWKRSAHEVLQEERDVTKAGRLRFAGVTTANYHQGKNNGVDYPEIVVAGYIDKDGGDGCNLDQSNFGVYAFRYTGSAYERILSNKQVAHTTSSKKINGDGKVLDPFCVQGVALRGNTVPESVFIEGSIYDFDLTNGTFVFKFADGKITDHSDVNSAFLPFTPGIQMAVAGNFNGNAAGMEQVHFTAYNHQSDDDYDYSIGTYWHNGKYDEDGNPVYKSASSGNEIDNNDECVLTINAVDVGENDGMMVKIKEKELTYTEPEVLAILEAPPMFTELKYAAGDNNGRTEYGTSSSTGSGTTSSTSVSASVMVGYEYTDPITNSGGGVEATVTSEWTSESMQMTERSVEIVYSNDTGENTVVVFRTPVTVYTYDSKYIGEDGKEATQEVKIGVQGDPITNMISIDDYNKAAEMYGLYQITEGNTRWDGADLAIPGQPETYRETLPNAGDKHSWTVDDAYASTYSGKGTISQSLTDSMTEENSSSYDFSAEVEGFASVMGAKVGAGVGASFGSGEISVNSEAVTKLGAVSARPDVENADYYDFNWRFATWTIDMSNGMNETTDENGQKYNIDKIPVLGYIVQGEKAPPSTAENLILTEQTSDSMLLSWDQGSRPAEYYQIYRYEPDSFSPYVPVATVSGGNRVDGGYEYRLENLTPDTTYRYVISAFGNGIESVLSEDATGKTLSETASPIVFKNPVDASAEEGRTARFEVKVTDWGNYESISYQWQEKLPYGKWTNTGTNSPTLEITAIKAKDNALYRCIVSGHTPDFSVIPFYSESAEFKIGAANAVPLLDITRQGAAWSDNQKGTIDQPYSGFVRNVTRREEIKYTEGHANVDIIKPDSITESNPDGTKLTASVYNVTLTKSDNTTEEVYIAVAPDSDGYWYALAENDGTVVDDDGSTYDKYKIKDGAKIKKSERNYDFSGREFGSYPRNSHSELKHTITVGGVSLYYDILADKNLNLYMLGSNKDSETGEMVDEYYTYTPGMEGLGTEVNIKSEDLIYTVYDIDTNGNIIASYIKETDSTDDADGNITKYEEIFCELSKKDDGTINKTAVEKTVVDTFTFDGYNPLVNTSTADVNDVFTTENSVKGCSWYTQTVWDTIDPTWIIMSPRTVDNLDSENSLGEYPCTLVVTNTSTGKETKYSRTSNKGGQGWYASEPGLYSIKAVFADMESPTYYYLAKRAANDPLYALETTDADRNYSTEFTYGDTIYVEAKNYAGDEPAPEIKKLKFNGYEFTDAKFIKTFQACKSPLEAYDGSGNLIASTYITVNKKPVTVSLDWDGKESGSPADKSDISIVADGFLADEKYSLNDVFEITSELFDADGNVAKNRTGAFKVELNYKLLGGTLFLINYDATLIPAEFLVSGDTKKVSYSAGENGTVTARYSDYFRAFTSGTSLLEGERLIFTAAPVEGYSVDTWYINDKPSWEWPDEPWMEPTDNPNEYIGYSHNLVNTSGNTMTIDNFMGDLDILVTFKPNNFRVDYTVSLPVHGTLTAADSYGNTIASGASVSSGAAITFTATPENGYVVENWIVDNKTYTWSEDNSAIYRENTLTLENIDADKSVSVKFTAASSYKITAEAYADSGNVSAGGIIIDAKDAATGEAVDLNNVRYGAAVTFTAPVDDNLSVKEWQIDGVTQKDSGGQTSFTVYNITKDITVSAIIATAQIYTLSYNADSADASAELKAYHNGAEIASDTAVPAYIGVDFEVINLSDGYYIESWSNNVTVDAQDNKKATLKSLDADTTVTVTIRKKPVITFTGDENVTVSAVQSEKALASGEYVEANSGDIIFTAVPDIGSVTTKWTVNGEEVTPEYVSKDENDTTAYTFKGEITGDLTISVESEALPEYTIKMTADEIEEGSTRGTLSASVKRKAIAAYNQDNITNSGTFFEGSDIEIIAAPEAGYRVQLWTVNGEAQETTKSTLKIEDVSEDLDVNVRFSKLAQGITFGVDAAEQGGYIAEAEAAGMSVIDNGTGLLLGEGVALTLTAVASPEYELKYWTANDELIEGSEGQLELVYVSRGEGEAVYITPVFEKVKYEVTITAANGTVKASPAIPEDLLISSGTTVEFTATANEGYSFKTWKINGRDTGETANVLSLEIITNTEVEAVFEASIVELNYTADRDAKIIAKVNGERVESGDGVPYNSTVEFTVTPNQADTVEVWTVNAAEDTETKMTDTSDAPLTYTVTEIKDALAVHARVIEKPVYTVTLADGFAGGKLSFNNDTEGLTSMQLPRGDSVVVKATVNPYWQFKHWIVDGTVQEGNSTTLTIDNIRKPVNISADFLAAISYPVNLTVDTTDNSTVSVNVNETAIYPGSDSSSAASVSGGSAVTFTANPADGKMVMAWTVNGVKVTNENAAELGITMSDGAVSNVLTINGLSESTHVKAEFEDIQLFAIPTAKDDEYSLQSMTKLPADIGDENQIRKGGSLKFKVVPAEGKVITALAIDGYPDAKITRNTGGSFSVEVNNIINDVIINASTENGVPLTINCGDNGTLVVKNGETRLTNGELVLKGDVLTITAAANSGYKLQELIVNSKAFTSGKTYTVGDETEAIISASFKKSSSGGGGGGSGSSGGGGGGFGGGSGKPSEIQPDNTKPELPFTDVNETDWYYDVVKTAYERSLMNGTTETTFSPDENITRAMFVTILYRAEGEPAAPKLNFLDVPAGEYYTEAVAWANANGIVNGVSDTEFAPNDNITREQMAAILYRYAQYKGADLVTLAENLGGFVDNDKISEYAISALNWAVGNEIINGKPDNILEPQGNATRAEAAATLIRLINKI